jgi:hypothetical protein
VAHLTRHNVKPSNPVVPGGQVVVAVAPQRFQLVPPETPPPVAHSAQRHDRVEADSWKRCKAMEGGPQLRMS